MSPKELKQLYDSLTGIDTGGYQYVKDEAPTYVDVAALNRLATPMYRAPDPLAGLDALAYALNGGV